MSETKKLIESMNSNLNEENDLVGKPNINNMEIDEMIKEYATICDNAGMNTFEILDNLLKYDVLNTDSFRNMLQDLNNYLEDNK